MIFNDQQLEVHKQWLQLMLIQKLSGENKELWTLGKSAVEFSSKLNSLLK
jgi:hypothetical protein